LLGCRSKNIMDAYTIRTLTRDDQAIAWTMLMYAAHETSLESVRKQSCLARYAAGWGSRTGDLGYVICLGETPVGAAWLRLWLGEDQGFGFVSKEIPELAMAVLPAYQGQGLGTHLLAKILEEAKDKFPGVSLSVRADNIAAVRMYDRLGFVRLAGSEIINRLGEVSFNMVWVK